MLKQTKPKPIIHFEKIKAKPCFLKYRTKRMRDIISKYNSETGKDFYDLPLEEQKTTYSYYYGRFYAEKNASKQKVANAKYYIENVEKCRAIAKKWYEANKEKAKKHMREYAEKCRREQGIKPRRSPNSIECPCGGFHTPINIKAHRATKKHQRWLEKMK
tara:strand:+ start:128 stop:607 length:480 start_codon:yes stop_codon:yes gene_type:complete